VYIFNEEELLDIIGAVDIVAFPLLKGRMIMSAN